MTKWNLVSRKGFRYPDCNSRSMKRTFHIAGPPKNWSTSHVSDLSKRSCEGGKLMAAPKRHGVEQIIA